MMENSDIGVLLCSIKEDIQIVEGGEVSESLLSGVRTDFLELIELIKLFLISERDSYYGYFLMNMQVRVNFCGNSIAGIRLNEFPPVFESNPLLLCKFKLKEILYIVCHEIDHIVLNHPTEMIRSNPTGDREIFHKFNLAADAAVNDRINAEIRTEKHMFLQQPEGAITSKVLSDMFQLGKIEAKKDYLYYFNLIRDKESVEEATTGQARMMEGKKRKTGNFDCDYEIITAENCAGNINDHDWSLGGDAEDAAAAVKELVNAAVGMMNEEARSLMPGDFMSQVEIINKPPQLPWQAILKRYVGTITANKRKTQTRFNRRQPDRFDLPGRMDDKVLKLVVAIDTSGSVSDPMISKILNEIFSILAKRKHEITVIECDAAIRRIYRARTPADIKTKVMGRGGTQFSPVIDYINQNKYFRDALLIYFTDGYGEHMIPKPRTYRNLWVVAGGAENLSLDEPFGLVLSL